MQSRRPKWKRGKGTGKKATDQEPDQTSSQECVLTFKDGSKVNVPRGTLPDVKGRKLPRGKKVRSKRSSERGTIEEKKLREISEDGPLGPGQLRLNQKNCCICGGTKVVWSYYHERTKAGDLVGNSEGIEGVEFCPACYGHQGIEDGPTLRQ